MRVVQHFIDQHRQHGRFGQARRILRQPQREGLWIGAGSHGALALRRPRGGGRRASTRLARRRRLVAVILAGALALGQAIHDNQPLLAQEREGVAECTDRVQAHFGAIERVLAGVEVVGGAQLRQRLARTEIVGTVEEEEHGLILRQSRRAGNCAAKRALPPAPAPAA